jgi:hypothetical protein
MKDGSLCINNKVMDNLALILTDSSIDVMINQQRLNSYAYVNVTVTDVKASRRNRNPKQQGTTLDDTTMRDVLNGIGFKFKITVIPKLRDPHHIVSKMHGGFDARMRTQQKYEWRNSHPLVVEQKNKIIRLTKRKREHDSLSKGEERIIRCKTERDDLRTKNMEVIAIELD